MSGLGSNTSPIPINGSSSPTSAWSGSCEPAYREKYPGSAPTGGAGVFFTTRSLRTGELGDVVDPLPGAEAVQANAELDKLLGHDAHIDPEDAPLEHQAEQGGQGEGDEPQGGGVDDGGGPHVAAAPQHPHDIHAVEVPQGHLEGLDGDHHHGDGRGPRRQVEQGEHHRRGDPPGEDEQGHAQGGAGEEAQGGQGLPRGEHLLCASGAHLPADDDGGGGGNAEAHHVHHLLHIGGDGIGGQDLGAVGHVAHDGGHHGGAQPPHGLVQHHGAAVQEEAAQHLPPRTEQGGEVHPEKPGDQHVDGDGAHLEDPGDQGGQGGPTHPHDRGAQMAEDEHPVEEGVQTHGGDEDVHAQLGLFHAAIGGNIHHRKAVEEAGAFAIVLECVPAKLAEIISESINIPTIGIGAGSGCDGQILVYQDMLGMVSDFTPKFVKQFAKVGDVMKEAFAAYIEETKQGSFPAPEHTFKISEDVINKLY